MRNCECVKNFRGHPLVSERRKVDAVPCPQARIAKLGESPEVDELQSEVVGDAAEQFVVDGGPAPQPPKKRDGSEVARGEGEHVGAGLLQGLQGVGVSGHHRVDVVAHQKQVVHARVDGDEVGFEHDRGLNLIRKNLVHPAATHREVGVPKLRTVLRKLECDVIRPSAQTVRAGGMWVADTLGERIAKGHVSGEYAHETNLAQPTTVFSPAAPSIRESSSAVLPLFASA